MDITKIPIEQLNEDKLASIKDILDCKNALAWGVHKYGDNESVTDRVEVNESIVVKIEKELKRRKDG